MATPPTRRTKPPVRVVPDADSAASGERGEPASVGSSHDYVLPVVHVHLPEQPANMIFWAALAAAAVVGAVDLPVAAFLGCAVLVAKRHNRR